MADEFSILFLVAESFNNEIFRAQYGKYLLTPRLMPIKRAAKSVFRVAYSVLKLGNGRLKAHSAFKIQCAHENVALSLFVSVKLYVGGRQNYGIMLGYYMIYG